MTAREDTQLHLLRHAHAGDPMKWQGPETDRPLSEKGRLQAERLGGLLAGAGFQPDAILSSPLTRALETARLVATPLEMPVIVVDALGRPLDLESVDRILKAAGDPRRPVLVGHDPASSLRRFLRTVRATFSSAPTDLPDRPFAISKPPCAWCA